MKHTPGPWSEYVRVINGECDETYRTIEAGAGFFDKEERGFALTGFISEADARLIAAAPDMLDELRHLLEDCIETDELEYADGTPYTYMKIVAYTSAIKRIRDLIEKVKAP